MVFIWLATGSIFQLCKNFEFDFLTIRLFSGFWIFLISLTLVAIDGSELLVYVTRFTEDIFAILISIIFISESVKFLIHVSLIVICKKLHRPGTITPLKTTSIIRGTTIMAVLKTTEFTILVMNRTPLY